jgi:hypothetical protein
MMQLFHFPTVQIRTRRTLAAALVAGLVGFVPAPATVDAQSPDLCSLLPQPSTDSARGADTQGENSVGKFCQRTYWVRPARPDITLMVYLTPSVADATRRVSQPAAAGYRPVSYGNGGNEKLEDTTRGAPSGLGILTGEGPDYQVTFRCGAYLISGIADPSKGVEARRMITQMSDDLRSLCGAPSAAPAQPVQTAAPPPPPSAPATGRVFSVGGNCERTGGSLLCAAGANNPPQGVPLGMIRYMWYLDGAEQGSRSQTFQIANLPPGSHIVGVKAFTPDAVYTDTFTIRVP